MKRRCGKVRLLPAFLEGELSEAGAAKVEEHLKACPSCRAYLQSLAEAEAALRRYGEHLRAQPCPTSVGRVLLARRGETTPSAYPGRRLVWAWGLAMALALGIGAGIWWMSPRPSPFSTPAEAPRVVVRPAPPRAEIAIRPSVPSAPTPRRVGRPPSPRPSKPPRGVNEEAPTTAEPSQGAVEFVLPLHPFQGESEAVEYILPIWRAGEGEVSL